MRNTSKATLSVITLGILAGSFQAGLVTSAANQNLAESLSASGHSSNGIDPSNAAASSSTDSASAATGSPSDSTNSSPSAVAGPSATTPAATNPAAPAPKATATAAPKNPTTPAPNQNNSSNGSGSSGTKSATGDAIFYRYGTIQVEVVKNGTSISAINLVQASTKGRQYEAVPQMLVNAAMSAQGTGFANVSGATFTSEAFRSALESAIGKL